MGLYDKQYCVHPMKDSYYVTTFELYKKLTGNVLDRQFVTDLRFSGDRGLVVYTDYTGNSATIHIHLPRQLKRNTISKMLSHPFSALGIKYLYAEMKHTNKPIVKLANKLGFKCCIVLKDFYSDGIDKLIMVATKEDLAKWIK